MSFHRQIVAACFAVGVVASPALSQEIEAGFLCSAQTSQQIGGISAIGIGEARLALSADYALQSTSFGYDIRDRVTGLGRMSASWSLPDRQFDQSAQMQRWSMRLGRSLADGAYLLTVSLDGSPVFERQVEPGDPTFFESETGGAVQRLVAGRGSWMPDLRGARVLTVNLSTLEGETVLADTFLLPDWSEFADEARSALRSADRDRRRQQCSRSFTLPRPRAQ